MRKYQRIRLGAGDLLLPSNDGRTMYRFLRYEEDGTAERENARGKWVPLVGWWWRIMELSMVTVRQEAARGLDPWDYPWDDPIAGPFKTLREATEYVEDLMRRSHHEAVRSEREGSGS